jgi:Fe-S cluster assembly protein SufD
LTIVLLLNTKESTLPALRVFDGKVIIREKAIKTDAAQSNKNLILSKNAGMNSNPQMEIYNDDVKCTHGSSTGELDPEALFYMRSRGLSLVSAKSLLIRGFLSDLIDDINHEGLRKYLLIEFDNWLVENHKL